MTNSPLNKTVFSKSSQERTAWWLTAPALLLMFVILLMPVLVAGYLSFTNYSLGGSNFDWVGFKIRELIMIPQDRSDGAVLDLVKVGL